MEKQKASSSRRRKISRLLSLMNKQNFRFMPINNPLIDMMDMSITDDELNFLLRIGTDNFGYKHLKEMSEMDENEFQIFFNTLMRKGLLRPESSETDKERYRLNAIVVGWYESMMHYLAGKPQAKEFSEKLDGYFKFFRKFNFPPVRSIQNAVSRHMIKPNQSVGLLGSKTAGANKRRTIPINTDVSAPESNVYPLSWVDELIEAYSDKGSIYVFPCVCRRGGHLLDADCKMEISEDACIGFGAMEKAWKDFGYGRSVDKKEAIEILRKVRDKGAVHTVIHERDDPSQPVVAICNCCWDCCGILKPYNMGAVPLKYTSYYQARVKDISACKGCGNCEKYCPTTAARVIDEKVSINSDICIGCGQCAYQCRQNNIEMLFNERVVFLPVLKRSEIRVPAYGTSYKGSVPNEVQRG